MSVVQSLSASILTEVLLGFLVSLVDLTAATTGPLQAVEISPQTEPIRNKRTNPPYDKDACPDQSHWIFIGVLVGLGTGIFILWLLNCFHLPPRDTEERSTKSIA